MPGLQKKGRRGTRTGLGARTWATPASMVVFTPRNASAGRLRGVQRRSRFRNAAATQVIAGRATTSAHRGAATGVTWGSDSGQGGDGDGTGQVELVGSSGEGWILEGYPIEAGLAVMGDEGFVGFQGLDAELLGAREAG